MTFDRDSYKTSVLDPARRAGNVPPADLLVRYGLNRSELSSDQVVTARIAEVCGYWNSLRAGNNKLYKTLVDALLGAHADLEQRGELTAAAFRAQRDKAETEARKRLALRVGSIAKSLSCVTLETLARLVEDGAGMLSEREVRNELGKQGIRIIEAPWAIPAAPPLPAARKLPDHLTVLGLRLSVEIVLGADGLRAGFSLKQGFRAQGGKVLGKDTLDSVRERMATRGHDQRKTASNSIITVLQLALDTPGKLDELLIWELSAILRRDVAAGLPVSAVADSAIELGLDPAEAQELAVTLISAGAPAAPDTAPDAGEQVEELIRAGDLRGAEELVRSLPADAVRQPTRDLLDRSRAELAKLVAEADAAHAGGDTEREAELLAQVMLRDTDDDLRRRLDRIPPPPPSDVAVMADGDRIVVSWRHSQTRTGRTRYRVLRSASGPVTSAEAHGLIGEVETDSAVDPRPPVGVPNHYTVFARRGDGAWSAGVAGGPVAILPEVGGLTLDATATAVSGAWTVSPEAIDVEVERADPATGATERVALLPGGREGFLDEAVRTGVLYEYRVRAIYRGATGDRLATVGAVATIRPQDEPVAVADLSAESLMTGGSPVIELRWTEPAAGVVEVRSASVAPSWAAGAAVPLEVVRSYGRRHSGVPARTADGRSALRVPARDGTTYFTVVSVGLRHAMAGNVVRHTGTRPVSDLRAKRLGTRIRLSWIWPDEAATALVTWIGEDGRGEQECLRREFIDDGGFTLDAGTGAVEVSVMTLTRDAGGRVLSAAETRRVPARRPHVRYSFDRRGFWRRRTVLVLTADDACEVPPIAVVRGRTHARPEALDGGEVMARIPRSRIAPDQPVEHPLGSSRQVGPVPVLACFIDTTSAPDGGPDGGPVFGPA